MKATHRLFHQGDNHIIDIGAGGSCDDKPLHGLQGVVGIVVLQGIEHVPALFCQSGGGVAVHIAASGIGGTVGAVTAHGEHCGVLSRQRRSCGQSELLIAAPLTLAGQVYHRLTACNKCQLFALPGVGASDGPQKAACFLGFTAELVGEEDGLVAQLPAGFGGSGYPKDVG